ncbi:MAG: hypothetical protein ACNA8L_03675 [Luteolibacter sp.]
MDMEDAYPEYEELISREPTVEDLEALCRCLNDLGARYIVIGGFAIRGAGYIRGTMDVDLIIALDPENEARVFEALRSLPDRAVDELDPGDVAKYVVCRVNDEITVDLMGSASGIRYEDAVDEIIIRRIGDVDVPFASPRLLWRMKKSTHREKDALDMLFLKKWFEARGEEPPE